MRVIALIDGEHHPQVVRDALDRVAGQHEIVSVLFVGGEEKVSAAVLAEPRAHYGRDVVAGRELPEVEADAVFDLSGDPVLDLDDRLSLAAIALDRGMEYRAPGLRLTPPAVERLDSPVPIVSVIGTGKRTGKTAVAGQLAMTLTPAATGERLARTRHLTQQLRHVKSLPCRNAQAHLPIQRSR